MRLFSAALIGTALAASASQAAIIYADVIIDYYHSGPEVFAPGNGYGGPPDASEVPLTNAIDQNLGTYISLPTGSYISLGFSTGYIFDGAGDDLFIDEIGNGGEDAQLWVSSNFGLTFSLLTTVYGNQTNSLDLADYSYTDKINAVKLIGLDAGGSSPGFDVTAVWGLDGSTVIQPQGPVVPLPAGLPLILTGLGALALVARRKG